MMIDNKEKIKNKTGLEIGKLWVGKEEIKSLYNNENNPILFDDESGNFHMLPEENEDSVKEQIKGIKEKRNAIIECLEGKLKEKKYVDKYKINKFCGIGRSGALKKTDMMDAFNYIRVEDNGDRKYDLMFSRFFIDNNTVNCIICSYQFAFSKAEDYSYLRYPKSERAKSEFSINLESGYYNPITEYKDENVDNVVNEFIEYIESKNNE